MKPSAMKSPGVQQMQPGRQRGPRRKSGGRPLEGWSHELRLSPLSAPAPCSASKAEPPAAPFCFEGGAILCKSCSRPPPGGQG
ncbi:hypothetical protein DPEC_G00317330 [Dallia pectoralis]|uniref:Uncharacterized protein n=1 Tax=Dallia pectoralis TaxID=75939 RepID=A0ACC2FCZ1_DALPE|nr:hypothetical protein DPEC_G00317330 [Dallia pectoralis]